MSFGQTSFPILEAVLDTYTRSVKVGESEAWFGSKFMVAISKAFTPGEDAVIAWLTRQDGSYLLDLVPMSDGRDFIVLRRLYSIQSWSDALLEAEAHRFLLRLPTQHGTSDTPD